ncbi:hypothetical protein VJ918_07780 [Adlercreutzia sp. R21]|uniref:Zinc ribbon domain-containing protein n=1 Tax=Adlercreutzia wanghongyangiae TaxID=3111451 RepID=A0ABU6IKC3_9ACTN|nr:hypothetical protein [Adlercreutzia sp. R21]MEC4176781.1 hypothetical protein [Adlercreutzia sp. R7]MEC4184705.1 hypothetical protein [Adlercreutzia sp. R21]
MTEKGRSDKLEVARITGVQGIRAAMGVLAREAGGDREATSRPEGGMAAVGDAGKDADTSLPTTEVDAPHPVKTCAVCAADNDGAREVCWNCGASLRRVR